MGARVRVRVDVDVDVVGVRGWAVWLWNMDGACGGVVIVQMLHKGGS